MCLSPRRDKVRPRKKTRKSAGYELPDGNYVSCAFLYEMLVVEACELGSVAKLEFVENRAYIISYSSFA